MQQSRRFLFLLFGMIYFVQGVITAYQLNFFKPHMAGAGVDADRIAIVAALALLPFIVKLLFGLLSDRVSLLGFGHRLPYMILGVILCGLAFFAAYFVDPGQNFAVLAAMVLAATFAMALFDTTADAFAIEVVPSADYSRVQSFMAGGRASGLIILSLVLGFPYALCRMAQMFTARHPLGEIHRVSIRHRLPQLRIIQGAAQSPFGTACPS
jgi:PAT family beta-lactamase induction signal transducer AmpG